MILSSCQFEIFSYHSTICHLKCQKNKELKIKLILSSLRLLFVAVQDGVQNDCQDAGNDNSICKEHFKCTWKAVKESTIVQTDSCCYRYSRDEEVVLIVFEIDTSQNLHPLNRYKTKHNQHGSTKYWTWNDLCQSSKLRKETKENEETSCIVDWKTGLDTRQFHQAYVL